jgi:hypothetical protein
VASLWPGHEAKQDCKWCTPWQSIQTLPRRSLTSKCSRFHRARVNVIPFSPTTSKALTDRMCMKLTDAHEHYAQIDYNGSPQNRTINAESAHRNWSTPTPSPNKNTYFSATILWDSQSVGTWLGTSAVQNSEKTRSRYGIKFDFYGTDFQETHALYPIWCTEILHRVSWKPHKRMSRWQTYRRMEGRTDRGDPHISSLLESLKKA